jgi:hypothetical protein
MVAGAAGTALGSAGANVSNSKTGAVTNLSVIVRRKSRTKRKIFKSRRSSSRSPGQASSMPWTSMPWHRDGLFGPWVVVKPLMPSPTCSCRATTGWRWRQPDC